MDRPDILSDQNVKAAAKLLHRYYHEPDKKRLLSTGSHFDGWAGRGDTDDRDVITDSDAVAVSMLSVTVPAKAMVGLAEPETAARITELLKQIPTDVPLSSHSSEKQQPCSLAGALPPCSGKNSAERKATLGNRRHNRKQDHGQETAPPHPHLG